MLLFSDFVTPLKKRRMARASMCAELPTFTSAPATPIPESPLVVGHRSASLDTELGNRPDFTIPVLNAASLHRQEGEASNRLPNGFRLPSPQFSSPSADTSADNILEVRTTFYNHQLILVSEKRHGNIY